MKLQDVITHLENTIENKKQFLFEQESTYGTQTDVDTTYLDVIINFVRISIDELTRIVNDLKAVSNENTSP